MAMIITVPHVTSDGGISPNRLRTFLERSSMSLREFFLHVLFFPIFKELMKK